MSVSVKQERAAMKARVGRVAERFGLLIVWALTIAAFAIVEPGTFLTGQNFAAMLSSQSVIVFLTFALLLPLTTGDYDLSVAAVATLSAMLLAILNVQEHWPIGIAIVAALGTGLLVGLINGGLIVLLGIDSLIVTLGTGTILNGIVLWISGSKTFSGISSTLVDWVVIPKAFGLGLSFFYAVALCLALWYLLEFTPLGRQMLFVGRARRVARLSGLNVRRLRWGALAGCSLIGAGAGVLYAGTSGAADPSSGLTFLLPAFAAAFLGSTSIIPGRFNPFGSIIAVYFLVTGITGLSILGVDIFVQNLFYGGALVLAVALASLVRGRVGRAADDEE